MEKSYNTLSGSGQNHTRFLRNTQVTCLEVIGQSLGRREQGYVSFGYIPKPTFSIVPPALRGVLESRVFSMRAIRSALVMGGKIRGGGQCLQIHGGLSGKLLEASNPALFLRLRRSRLGLTPPHFLCKPHLSSVLAG